MKKVHFVAGVKPLVSDMNNLHTYTEEALFSLLQAVGGSSGRLLFNATPPVYSANNNIITITVPYQFFAVEGAVSYVPETQWTRSTTTDLVLGIYFILKKAPIPEERNFLSLNPDSIAVQQDLTTPVAFEDIGRVEVTVGTVITNPPEEPVLGAGDVGFVQLGFLTYNLNTGGFVYTGNSADLFTLPAATAQPAQPHAASHLSTDRIPDAAVNPGVDGGSTEGLLPRGGLTTLIGAIQDIQPTPTSSFVEVVYTGDNAPSGNTTEPKVALLHVNLASSLAAVVEDQAIKLGVNFKPASAVAGTSKQSARADHIHGLTEFGLIVMSQTISDLSIFVSGSFTVPSVGASGTVGKIISVTPYWVPPNAPANFYGVPCGWLLVSNPAAQTLGCRASITGSNTFFVEKGAAGAALITSELITKLAQDNIIWDNGQFAITGSIRLEILAARAGTFLS